MLPLLVTPGALDLLLTAATRLLLRNTDRQVGIDSRACQRRNEEKSERVVVIKRREKRIWGTKETLAPLRWRGARMRAGEEALSSGERELVRDPQIKP
jgi:hypothetical protein